MIVVEGAAEKNSYQGSWALCRIRWAGALASLDKGTFQKRFSGFCPLRGYPAPYPLNGKSV